jgi:hypothetical protein
MARDIQPKKASPATASPNEDKGPKYEYQKNDGRSFSVHYREPGADDRSSVPETENSASRVKIY